MYQIKVSSAAAIYRKEHPEYYKQERIKDNERVKTLIHNSHHAKKWSNKKY